MGNGNNIRFEFFVRALVLLTAFPIHESAHALVAHWLGDNTAKNMGRISLNPMKHITIWSALFMLFVGFGAATPVPINPKNFKNEKWGMAISSLAGPVSNLLLAYLSVVFYRVCLNMTYTSQLDYSIICEVFAYGAILNVGLAVFNLLPIPPLDGSRILTLFLPKKYYFGIMKYERYIMAGIFALFFAASYFPILSQIIYVPLNNLQNAVLSGLLFLSGWVDLFFM